MGLEQGLVMVSTTFFLDEEIALLDKIVDYPLYGTLCDFDHVRDIAHPKVWMLAQQE